VGHTHSGESTWVDGILRYEQTVSDVSTMLVSRGGGAARHVDAKPL
jgi:hypothetical protein